MSLTLLLTVWLASGGLPANADDPLPGTIMTVAGTGRLGFTGDGGPAVDAALAGPGELALSPAGELYFADILNHRVRKIRRDGTIVTVAGTGKAGFGGDGGPATLAALNLPEGVAVDGSGTLFIADLLNQRIRRVTPDGTITTIAGGGKKTFREAIGGSATEASLERPHSLAIDRAGNLYFTAADNHRVWKVTADGILQLIAGTGIAGFAGDGGPATAAQLSLPTGLAVDAAGNLYIGDFVNHRVRRVSADGTITTFAGGGTPANGLGDGGPAVEAQLDGLPSLAVDGNGNLFIADNRHARVRKVEPNGIISTVAGAGKVGFAGDGGPATAALLSGPWGLAIDRSGNLYISDTGQFNSDGRGVRPGNNRIRVVFGIAAPR